MELNEYQKKASSTCMPSCDNFSYMFINLVGEIGELASKVAKHIRKEKACVDRNKLYLNHVESKERVDIMKELGDCLWQLSGLCKVMGWSLDYVAQENLLKLAERAKNGTIDGNGDGVTKEERK